MDRTNILTVILLIVFLQISGGNAQNQDKIGDSKSNRFLRFNNETFHKALYTNYYPNSTGDFWEYIVKDTTTLFDQLYALNFSITKEVLSDTLMPNGKTYKQIKWENIANSVDYLPWYEYQRVDSAGNVFLYYDNEDFLLFDFNLSVGQTYTSHLSNHSWRISDKYNVIGFGDTVVATDFELYESGIILKEKYTVAEKFGIIYYLKNIHEYAVPEGSFWGAVINGTTYGTMMAKKQTVDWSEFYPLHVGDYWVYEGQSGSIPTFYSKKIITDTVLSDGNVYYKSFNIDYTFGYTSYSYARIDSIGRIFFWEYWGNEFRNNITLSDVVGDTVYDSFTSSFNRVDDKYISPLTKKEEIHFFLYPDIAFSGQDFCRSFGLFRTTADLSWTELRGCFIDGILWGDTILTDVKECYLVNPNGYELFSCYPNPYNPATNIIYEIKERGLVQIKVYNILAKEITTLVNEEKSRGRYSVNFNASNLPSGVYIYALRVNDYTASKKMILLK
jgi:hypothetical protein